jgi:N-acetylglutamate synthase-like GNAT family acetyltransferase
MAINNSPNMTISIRNAVASDLPEIEQITANAYHKYIAIMGQKPAPMVADYSAHLQDDMIFVAEDTSPRKVIGYAVIIAKDDEYWLETIAVEPLSSKKGVGSRLMAYVEDYISQFASEYHLYTNVKMTENIDWYLRLGFTETKRQKVDGYERVYFKKRLKH